MTKKCTSVVCASVTAELYHKKMKYGSVVETHDFRTARGTAVLPLSISTLSTPLNIHMRALALLNVCLS